MHFASEAAAAFAVANKQAKTDAKTTA